MNNSSRTIGMPYLGTRTTEFYLETLNSMWQGALPCPVFTLAVDFQRINANLPDKYAALKPLLGQLLEDLEEEGFTHYLIPNITLHAAIDRLELANEVRARIIHPLELGTSRLVESGIDQITLIGSRHTMLTNQLADTFQAKNITVQFPQVGEIEVLDKIRLEVFEAGYSVKLQEKMESILSKYSNVVVACTELSILNTENQNLDLARLQMAKTLALLSQS